MKIITMVFFSMFYNCYGQFGIDTIQNRVNINNQNFNEVEFCRYKTSKEIAFAPRIKQINLPDCIKEFDSLKLLLCEQTLIENPELIFGLQNLRLLYLKTRHYYLNFSNIPNLRLMHLTLTSHPIHGKIKFVHKNNIEYLKISSKKELEFDSSINNLTSLKNLSAPFNLFNGIFNYDSTNFKKLSEIYIYKVDFRTTTFKSEMLFQMSKVKLCFIDCKFTSNQISLLKSILINRVALYDCRMDKRKMKDIELINKNR